VWVEDSARARLGLPRAGEIEPGFEAVERSDPVSDELVYALAGLPEEKQRLPELRVVEERPYAQIAAQLQCTPEAARARVPEANVASTSTAITEALVPHFRLSVGAQNAPAGGG
jgi:RNA polymerase sigma-70 factor (ECF subfamily)